MQISTIHKLQHALDTSKKVIKFAWRHAFVLAMIWMLIEILIEGHTPKIEREFVVFAVAAFLDFIKIKIKFTSSNGNCAMEQMFESSKWSRPTQMVSAWDSYDPGSPAYYIRQDRYC